MKVKQINSLTEIDATIWNRIANSTYPFIQHEFLLALEQCACVDADTGWQTQHIIVLDQQRLVAIMPMYCKSHSRGEYVFDHQWTYAYRQHGITYFPKWLSAIPFTPCQDKRIFIDPGYDQQTVIDAILDYLPSAAEQFNISSWHCLFPDRNQAELLQHDNYILRNDVQFRWRNKSYRDFDDYLEVLNSKYRKKIKRERRRINEAGIEMLCLSGREIRYEHIDILFPFYLMTYAKNGMPAYLNKDFFYHIKAVMPDSLLLILAKKENRYVGAALSFVSPDTLYGRYWGCQEEYHSLHFEACYYQGIDYCISQGLKTFDSGAQGEHKLARGFEPELTYSIHWFRHPEFAVAIEAYLKREAVAVQKYQQAACGYLPFKKV